MSKERENMQITITNDVFGKNLMHYRKHYRLSRLSLAKLIGTAQVLIAAWEEGRVYPTLAADTLERICTIFQIDIQSLLYAELP